VATFIVLCTFDKAGVSQLMADGKDDDTADKLMKEVGGTLEHIWLTTGAFDMVAVVEAPAVGKALAFLVAFSSMGGIATQTLSAEEGVGQVFADANNAKTNIGSGGNG